MMVTGVVIQGRHKNAVKTFNVRVANAVANSSREENVSTIGSGVVTCAAEDTTCMCNGTVSYGAGASWVEKDVSGSIACSNSAFGGDPNVGVFKTCTCAEWGTSVDGGFTFTVPEGLPSNAKHEIYFAAPVPARWPRPPPPPGGTPNVRARTNRTLW